MDIQTVPFSQCIPDGVTMEDIRADPEWASPLCREFLHASMSWDTAYFEAVIVNLKLNFTVNYIGAAYLSELVMKRTAAGIPTLFYGFTPGVLVERVNGTHGRRLNKKGNSAGPPSNEKGFTYQHDKGGSDF
eukprot:1183509-Prorocentrum_minimum.AAC.1